METKTFISFIGLLMVLFSCQKREWNNPFDPDCPKESFTPSNFKSELQGNEVKLSWNQSNTHISGFKIERKVADGSWSEVASLGKSTTTWNDANLTGGKLHEYRLYAYAGNNLSNKVTTQITLLFVATITTTAISSVTSSSASSGGTISSDGGAPVTARGVCWGTSPNPTITGSKTTDGTGTGSFTSTITGLTAGTTYYVRAYATNSVGTAYGIQVNFNTVCNLPSAPSTITGSTSITPNALAVTYSISAVSGATSYNWTVPAGAMIASGQGTTNITINFGTSGGNVSVCAQNSCGNSAYTDLTVTTCSIPATPGAITGSTTITTNAMAVTYSISAVSGATSYNWTVPVGATIASGQGTTNVTVNFGTSGGNVSVRAQNSCGNSAYTDLAVTISVSLPTLTTSAITAVTSITASSGGNISSDGGSPVTARGVCWGTSPVPTISGSKTTNGTGIGSFASAITGLSAATIYYVRAYATNIVGTAYGNEISYTTPSLTVTDADGNVYNTVTIGTQLWMAENLKVTKYNDKTAIPLVTNNSIWSDLITPGYSWYDNDATTNKNTYGALYNWYAVNTGKLCPSGWHVPTDAEWTALTTYLGGEIVAGGKIKETGITHWASPNNATNSTHFTALPGGFHGSNGEFYSIGFVGCWWSSTENTATTPWYITLYNTNEVVARYGNDLKDNGFSIRCLRD